VQWVNYTRTSTCRYYLCHGHVLGISRVCRRIGTSVRVSCARIGQWYFPVHSMQCIYPMAMQILHHLHENILLTTREHAIKWVSPHCMKHVAVFGWVRRTSQIRAKYKQEGVHGLGWLPIQWEIYCTLNTPPHFQALPFFMIQKVYFFLVSTFGSNWPNASTVAHFFSCSCWYCLPIWRTQSHPTFCVQDSCSLSR
jgi:hypothetical protein